ncbi:hypothetical protein BY996DRAFT_4599731, partial [Phakopsora pachyrhizi]
ENSENKDVMPVMSPITKEQLAVNRALIKSWILTVLKRSPYLGMSHSSVIKAIGTAEPTKDNRRRINSYIKSNVKCGKVAIIKVNGHLSCFQLLKLGETLMGTAVTTASETLVAVSEEESEDELVYLPMTRSFTR